MSLWLLSFNVFLSSFFVTNQCPCHCLKSFFLPSITTSHEQDIFYILTVPKFLRQNFYRSRVSQIVCMWSITKIINQAQSQKEAPTMLISSILIRAFFSSPPDFHFFFSYITFSPTFTCIHRVTSICMPLSLMHHACNLVYIIETRNYTCNIESVRQGRQ